MVRRYFQQARATCLSSHPGASVIRNAWSPHDQQLAVHNDSRHRTTQRMKQKMKAPDDWKLRT